MGWGSAGSYFDTVADALIENGAADAIERDEKERAALDAAFPKGRDV
jgi:hypothetical protein